MKIKIARLTKGLTQEELAEKINKTRPLVSHVEQTGKVNEHTLKLICKELDIDRYALEDGVYEPAGYYQRENAQKQEIERLNEKVNMLTEIINMQKEVIAELRQKTKKKAGK